MNDSDRGHVLVLTVAGSTVVLNKEERGYFLGSIEIEDRNFHVEAIEAKVKVSKLGKHKGETEVTAVNSMYQSRIDKWEEGNDQERPQTIEKNGKRYFICIEHFAV